MMTTLDMRTLPNSDAAPHRPIARAVMRSVARLLELPVRAYRAWRDTEHVMGLSDHLLKDIGVARCEIDAAVRWGRER
jgi:uncharacterized protein YjiS (DUF1127 family)